jgi:hypothetical protein
MPVEPVSRTSRIEAADVLLGYQWTFLGHLWREVDGEFGPQGVEALASGFRRYGQWVAEEITTAQRGSGGDGHGRTPLADWPSLEFGLSRARGELVDTASAGSVISVLTPMPGHPQLVPSGAIDVHGLFWRNVLEGLHQALGAVWDCSVDSDRETGRWEITWASGEVSPTSPPKRLVFDDASEFIHASRATLRALAAIEMYVFFEVQERLGATGEEALGRAIYAYDAERAMTMRLEHEAAGVPRTIASLTLNNSASRDPYHAMFGSLPDSRISDGLYGVDVFYCPLADVWASEGPRGLAAGYLYDTCSHRGLFESYLPGTIVKWDTLKTRGDHVCRFRVTAPGLLTDEDRRWISAHAHEDRGGR